MPVITEVIIDRRVLDAFKRRALKAYPRETMELLIGRITGTHARIFALRDVEHEGQRRNIVMDDDVNPMLEGDVEGSRMAVLGTIHTHPQDSVEPSELDWKSMKQDGELVMGICAIRLSKQRKFTTLAFWTSRRKQLPWTVAETRKKTE